MKQALNIFTIFILAVATLNGCTKKKSAYDLNPKETLRIRLGAEPPSLDWSKSSDTTSAEIQDNIMEGLLEYNLKDPDLSLKPSLATEWKGENNATKWTFKLRKDVKWTDGQPFTAQNIVDSWERLLNPKTAAIYSYFLFGLKNAQKYNQGEIKDFSQVGVSINEEGSLVVELEEPQSFFPYLLTHHCTYPLRKDVVEKFGDQWTDPKNIQTLGPYKLIRWDHDKAIVLKANPGYYAEQPKTKNILARIIKNEQTALSLFDTKKIDSLNALPSVEIPHLKKRKEFRAVGILGTYYYGFNTKKAPLDNTLVRKAISMAVDRKEITDLIGGLPTPMSAWVPPGMFGYNPDLGIKFNPEEAKKLLDKAGYSDRTKFPVLKIGFNTNEDHQRIAENVQAQLKRNLGIKVELDNAEWKVYLTTLKSNPPHLFRMGWVGDYPDPDNFLNLMTSYSDNNHTNWSDKKYDEIIKKAASLLQKAERKPLYDKAQKILTEEAVAVVPIYGYKTTWLVSGRVKNFPLNTMDRKKYKEVEVK